MKQWSVSAVVAALLFIGAPKHCGRPADGFSAAPPAPGQTVSSSLAPGMGRAGRPSHLRLAARAAAVVAGLYLVLAALVLLLENRFVYAPTSSPLVRWDAGVAGAEDCWFPAGDGARLHGWWREVDGQSSAVLLWCHGNAGNITHRTDNLVLLARTGLSVLVFDYRGYGLSEGTPSEDGLYLDADAAYRYLTQERGVGPERVVVFGRSLGAAVALELALRRDIAGLILEGTFRSVPAMARRVVPFVPVWFLARNRFDNAGRIGGLKVPLLMVHGGADALVPIKQARDVFDGASCPKAFYTVPGAGHNDTHIVGGREYAERIAAFCRRCVQGQTQGPAARTGPSAGG
jgi:fermentation-respiration switch protein FrsA (DUF1100 family)